MRTTLALLSLSTLTTAHTVFSNLWVNGVNQGDGTCIRMPRDSDTASHWIADPYNSPDMACGRDGASPVAFTCPATAGSKLTFEFRTSPDLNPNIPHPDRRASDLGPLDPSHKGPVAVYLKRLASPSSPAAGPGWFKIWHAGYDAAARKFATEKLIANQGLLSIQLPSDLPAGDYLVRPELLALHTSGQPQFYTGCAQVSVTGGGGSGELSVPADKTVSIPGHVHPDDKGVAFNIYAEALALPYVIPGPGVFFPGGSSVSAQSEQAGKPFRAAAAQGANECLLKNGNWCGVETPAYTTEAGCWASTQDCWDQSEACFRDAGPTGGANCQVWERDKCKRMEEECNAGEAGKSWAGPRSRVLREVFLNEKAGGEIPPVGNVDEGGVEAGRVSGGGEGMPVVKPAPPTGFVTSVLPPVNTRVAAEEETTSHTTNTMTKTTTVTVPGADAAPTAPVGVVPAPPVPTGVYVPSGLVPQPPRKALPTGTPSRPCAKGKGKFAGQRGEGGRYRRV